MQAKLQVQDITGQWITVGSSMMQDQIISKQLDTLSKTYKRVVRAVDASGNILQLK